MPEATIATTLLIDFIGFLGRRGLGAEAVCEAAQIDPRWLDEPHSRVPASAMERLWAVGERLTGDPDLGLHSAESYNPGALSIVGYVILSCRTAGDALDRLARYAPLLNEGLQVRLDHDAARGLTTCRFGAAEGVHSFLHHSPRQAIETLAAGIVLTLKRLATSPPEPLSVSFRHAAPSALAEHHRLLGPAVRFEQAENTVVYPREALAAGMLSADPALLEVLEGDARRRLELLKARGAISGRVQTLLGARPRGEVPSLASIAAELAMSERSVQRSLSEESTSYREIVDEVRKGLALSHLSRPGSTATDVAFLLGFSEPSAFTRAFRRWTGASPSQYKLA
ncbi:MAG: AraC family transcriptional regulator [Ramlibacter sp.]